MTRLPRPEQDGDDLSGVYRASRKKRTRATRDAIEQHLPLAELARLKEFEALERGAVERRGALVMTAHPDLPLRLTREELAKFWRVDIRTLQRREAKGIGPNPIRIGGRVLYRRDDVLAWEQAQITGSGA